MRIHLSGHPLFIFLSEDENLIYVSSCYRLYDVFFATEYEFNEYNNLKFNYIEEIKMKNEGII